MRISDWSSDVCSSDLSGPWLDLGTGAGFPGLVVAVLRPDQPMVLVESRPLRAQWLSRMVSELALKCCRIEARRIEAVNLSPRVSFRHAPLPPRSEEHTSELQSIMRISYAVFCSKKKKTNKYI